MIVLLVLNCVYAALQALTPGVTCSTVIFLLFNNPVCMQPFQLLVTALALLAAAGRAAAQPTNALPGQPPIVFHGRVLPDRTFVESTWLQVAGRSFSLPLLSLVCHVVWSQASRLHSR